MDNSYQTFGKLQIHQEIFQLFNQNVLPQININQGDFWSGLESLLDELTPENNQLLEKRSQLQQQIDNYHQQHKSINQQHYQEFLTDIGYLEPNTSSEQINVSRVDQEISTIYGPQLVVPVMNARYALNAANARWGSLYDALYGTDALTVDAPTKAGYDTSRGKLVIEYAKNWLNQVLPLENASHHDVIHISITNQGCVFHTKAGEQQLKNPDAFVGFNGDAAEPTEVIFKHHQLHIIVQVDPTHIVGQQDSANIKDIVLESAITAIMDCEDSVAAVDGEDKALVYKNWLGLMDGSLQESVTKNGKSFTRALNQDLTYTNQQAQKQSLSGRALMFVRNVGHLMTTPAVLFNNQPAYEGLLDAVFTSAIGKVDLLKQQGNKNSQQGSIYIVKPKMHGSSEVAFANTLFTKVEQLLNLEANQIKLGIMDEERRTSVNLPACINAAKERVVFINTGFLDRTGDEIHTSLKAGVFAPKTQLKQYPWLGAYEQANVVAGLNAGFANTAQIGKGMWPIPDQMANMLEQKIDHLKQGATTAWVPSPTAATLHVLHYHQVACDKQQQHINGDHQQLVNDILSVPLLDSPSSLSASDIEQELRNNAQGILGYVVRWVDQGVGCSKVPDINNVGLMEDRATCRISSQHMANWLYHGVCSEEQVVSIMKEMAMVVDQQNSNDPTYENMADNYAESLAFNAALELVLQGHVQPNGYTEPVLHKYRLLKKKQ